jgi:hypothetical protein
MEKILENEIITTLYSNMSNMTEIAEKYPNTLNFYRTEMTATSCIDEETRERVYQCVTKHAIETLGDGNDCGEVESFLSQEGFPFTMARYEIGNVMIDGDYNIAADYVRHLIDCFRKDGVGKNYSTLDEGPSISWIARGDRFSFFVNDEKPFLFVNGTNTDELVGYFKNFSDRLDSVLAPMEVIEQWKRECPNAN